MWSGINNAQTKLHKGLWYTEANGMEMNLRQQVLDAQLIVLISNALWDSFWEPAKSLKTNVLQM